MKFVLLSALACCLTFLISVQKLNAQTTYCNPMNLDYGFTPIPNFGAKEPLYKNELCYGEDMTSIAKVSKLELKWLIKAYNSTWDKSKFFNPFFKLPSALFLAPKKLLLT
jgi:hypothetical protein